MWEVLVGSFACLSVGILLVGIASVREAFKGGAK